MLKVYIINKGCHDFSMAEKYGQLVYMTKGRYDILAVGKMYRVFQEKMKGSKSSDLILICGPATMSAVACSMFAAKHGRLNLLVYLTTTSGGGYYKKRTIVLEG